MKSMGPAFALPSGWRRVGLGVALIALAWSQLHCLEKAERRCESQASCDGAARPSVCFQGKCVLKVCDPGKRQRCWEASCDAQGTACPTSLRGIGGCEDGYQLCVDNGSRWSACVGSNPPTDEICDGIDNDCDGQTDEDLDCSCRPGETKECYTAAPSTRSSSGSPTPCGPGVRYCQGDPPRWSECQHQRRPQDFLTQQNVSTCQLTDADCDGKLDAFGIDCSCEKEGESRPCYAGPEGTDQSAPCKAGTQTCKTIDGALRWGACTDQILPTPEEIDPCNGKDDDCDGMIDNRTGQTTPLYRPCGDKAACHIQVCKDATWSLCSSQELCGNQQDDNCDGMIDEQPCTK